MGLAGLEPATGMFKGAFITLGKYIWVLIPIVAILSIIGVVWWIKKIKAKKAQWTHKLKIRRVLFGNRLSDPIYQRMRRFPMIKEAEVFELEKPLLGGFLLPELDEYSGENEFSIILNKNNRIFTNKGEFFCPDKSSVNVSAKHAEIDIQRSKLKSDYQNINKINKRIEWSEIAKYAFMIMAIICLMLFGMVAMQNWSEAQGAKAQESKSTAVAMEQLAQAMVTMQATVNTQKLEILPMMREIYKTKNIGTIINAEVNIDESS